MIKNTMVVKDLFKQETIDILSTFIQGEATSGIAFNRGTYDPTVNELRAEKIAIYFHTEMHYKQIMLIHGFRHRGSKGVVRIQYISIPKVSLSQMIHYPVISLDSSYCAMIGFEYQIHGVEIHGSLLFNGARSVDVLSIYHGHERYTHVCIQDDDLLVKINSLIPPSDVVNVYVMDNPERTCFVSIYNEDDK